MGRFGAIRVARRDVFDFAVIGAYPPPHNGGKTRPAYHDVMKEMDDALNNKRLCPARCTPVVLLDVNAHLGREKDGITGLWSSGLCELIGEEGAETMNSNGAYFKEWLEAHRYVATNTFIDLGPTFYSQGNDGETRPDYILCEESLWHSGRVSYPYKLDHLSNQLQLYGEAFYTDHRAIGIQIDLKLKYKGTQTQTRIDRDAMVFAAKHGGPLAQQYVDEVNAWCRHSEEEWTTKRCGKLGATFDYLADGLQKTMENVFELKKKTDPMKQRKERRKELLSARHAAREEHCAKVRRAFYLPCERSVERTSTQDAERNSDASHAQQPYHTNHPDLGSKRVPNVLGVLLGMEPINTGSIWEGKEELKEIQAKLKRVKRATIVGNRRRLEEELVEAMACGEGHLAWVKARARANWQLGPKIVSTHVSRKVRHRHRNGQTL